MWFKIILVFILFKKKKKKSQHFKNIFDVEEIKGHKEVILLCICHDSCDAQIN